MFSIADINIMATSADAAIENALSVGSSAMTKPPRSEVGFVAAVTLGAIKNIANAWGPICQKNGYSLGLRGIFCHASPMVKYKPTMGRPITCELADLLIVVDVIKSGQMVRKAALIQAKMACAAQRVKLSGASSCKQLELYQNWFPFDFCEDIFSLKNINFNTDTNAKYSGTIGVIDRHLKTHPIWTQHAATPCPKIVSNQVELGRFIAKMTAGSCPGFGRLATPSLNSDWSKTIEQLLKITGSRSFKHGATLGQAAAPRGTLALCLISPSAVQNLRAGAWQRTDGRPPFDEAELEIGDYVSQGANILHIALSEIPDQP